MTKEKYADWVDEHYCKCEHKEPEEIERGEFMCLNCNKEILNDNDYDYEPEPTDDEIKSLDKKI